MAEYIEREALCYQLAKQATIDGQPRAIRRAARIVADFPADDVRPVVRGKWEIKGEFANCTVCKEGLRIECGIELFDEMPHFCPNCGAWMEER